MREHQGQFSVSRMCRLLAVSCSGFYAWRSRPESRRVLEDRALLAHIEAIHHESREAYGAVKTEQQQRRSTQRQGRFRNRSVAFII